MAVRLHPFPLDAGRLAAIKAAWDKYGPWEKATHSGVCMLGAVVDFDALLEHYADLTAERDAARANLDKARDEALEESAVMFEESAAWHDNRAVAYDWAKDPGQAGRCRATAEYARVAAVAVRSMKHGASARAGAEPL